MTIIAAAPQKDWGIILTDSYSHRYAGFGDAGGGTFINKVHTFPQWDMALAMNGSVHVCELFRQAINGAELADGLDDLEEDGADIFRQVWRQAEADFDPEWEGGETVLDAHPLTMAQVALVGWSHERGTFAAVSITKTPDHDCSVQVEEPGGGIFSPAVADFAWTAKANTRKGFMAELLRYSQQQFEVYHDLTADRGIDADAPKTGGQAIATILQRGSVEQRVIGSYPNHRELCEANEARPAPVPASVKAPVSAGPDASERGRKVGRNEPCPCGSGKKFKRCCGA